LAPNQYFATLYQGITGTNRNDFVLVSVPQYVTNVVVYSNWNGSYFGDPVNYVNPSGVTEQLTYGLTAAANISTGLSYLQPSGGNSTISIANATYAEQLGGFAGNLSINIIGANSVTNTALGNVNGNITVDSISLNANNTVNFRVNAGVGVTTGDQINTSGLISVGNAIANISLNGNFSNSGLNTGNFLSLINNTNGTSSNPIVGSFRNSNGSTLLAGQYFSVTGQTDKGFYATYKLGTASPYNDFALIYNYALGKVPNVVVNQTWSNPDQLDFGAFVTVGNTSYTIGIDAFGEMAAYTPTGGAPLAGAAVAAAPNGAVSIAAGTYNSTFTVDKGFTLTGPTNGTASFPASSGQTVLTANGSNAANITATSWTNNLLFGNLLVTSGTIFDNAARLIDDGGSLYFQGGTTFSNVSLSTNRSILIGSNVAGNPATLQSPSGGTAITVSGTGKTATLTDIRLNGSGTGVNLTNTGAVTFNNVTGTSSLASIGSISGTTSLTMNYASSSDNNTLTVRSGSLSFTPLGTSNLNITGQSGLTFNASIGTTAGSAGNNTIVLAANSTMAGGVIATGSGVDVFTISAPQPLTVNSGAGNDTLSIAAANAFLSTYNGEAGVNTFRSGPNSVNYIDLAAGRSGSAFINRGNTTTRSSFSNIDKVYGNGFTDIFSVTDANTTFSLVNGGNGNDQLNFNGTSGANTSFNVTQALLANISGSSAGSVSYYNFANSTAQLSIIDSFVSIENLRGGTGDDTFVMSQGGSLSGSLNGGSGNNTLDYSRFLSSSTSSTSPGVRVDLTNGMGTGIGGTSAGRVSNIRDAYGTVGFDFLTGDAGNNILDGGEGNDSILGMAGNDILIGGLGSDTIRGAQGDNLSISGYVNFDTGGTTSAYGIPSQYKPFVLRSMMNQWATGNQTDAQFDNTANSLSTTGVQVLVPGNTTYNNIALFTANSTSDPIKGTVFDDGSADTLDLQFSSYNWIFIPTAGEIVVNGTPRKVTYIYKLIP
jgi:Ca2+-binding RTX toxin-like protein